MRKGRKKKESGLCLTVSEGISTSRHSTITQGDCGLIAACGVG